MRRIASLCLAGSLTAVVLTLAINAVAHARIAAPIRWSGVFASHLATWDVQAVVGVAVAFALITAARIKSARSVPVSLVVAAVVTALGTPVAINLVGIGACFAPFSVEYTHPPASQCLYLVGGYSFAQQIMYSVIEAVLASIFLIPAAHYAGTVLTRHRAGRSRRRGSARALRWLAAGAAVTAVIAGTASRLSDASAHGIEPAGSIGRDGWIGGTGYQIRLYPSWYERAAARSQIALVNALDQSRLTIQSIISHRTAVEENSPRQDGARPVLLNGVEGLRMTHLVAGNQIEERWFVVNGHREYLVTLTAPAADAFLRVHSGVAW